MAGHLEIYLGPMCSGKTHFLFGKLATHTDLDNDFNILYINSSKDDRSMNGDNVLTTHHSHFQPPSEKNKKVIMKKVNKLSSITDNEIKQFHLIGIDEMQFFDDLLETVTHWVDDLKKRIICVGLDGTFDRKPWKNVMDLLPMAETFKKKNAYCKQCIQELGNNAPLKKAPFTHMYRDNEDKKDSSVPIVGGLEKFTPVCRKHYLLLNK